MQIEYVQQPEPALQRWLQSNQTSLVLEFEFEQYYLPQQPRLLLLAVLLRESHHHWSVSLSPSQTELQQALGSISGTATELRQLAQKFQLTWLQPQQPLLLQPVYIAKPWGQEIWYTGIEARGQSGVGPAGAAIPLPWLLALAPQLLLKQIEPRLILLKILDPLADEVYGDLYFEQHQQKQEVYIVTQIDPQAWPNGQGAIRLGFCPKQRSRYANDDEFKAAYLAAVQSYQQLRQQLDRLEDQQRQQAGIELNAPVAASQLKLWHQQAPQNLRQQEQDQRAVMDSFSRLVPLQLGDVVKVPCFTPHSLQHGVRTVEFQTPVYERQILSFGQKVLTQNHWDTEAALAQSQLDAPAATELVKLVEQPGLLIEQIVEFDDFEVWRVQLQAGGELQLPAQAYSLLILLSGVINLNSPSPLLPGQALLLTAQQQQSTITSPSDALLLLAFPK
jgi:hypothetical protein